MKIKKNTLLFLLSALALYFLSAGASYLIFSQTIEKSIMSAPDPVPVVGGNGQVAFDQSLQKTQ